MFPYYVRTKGLSWFQLFGRTAVMFGKLFQPAFPIFSTDRIGSFVNPIGLENIDWKYLIVYVVWLCFEIVFIYIFFPETYGKTLEELHFCKSYCKCEGAEGWLANEKQCLSPRKRNAMSWQPRQTRLSVTLRLLSYMSIQIRRHRTLKVLAF